MLNLTEEAKVGIVSGALGILVLMIICMACKLRRLRNPEYKDDSNNRYISKPHVKCGDCEQEQTSVDDGTLKVRSASFMQPHREKGMLKYSMEHQTSINKLVVTLIHGSNIVGRDFWDLVDCYVRLSIESEDNDEYKAQTKIVTKNLNPEFNETFYFDISFNDLRNKVMDLSIWELDKYTRHHVIGHVTERLDHVTMSDQVVVLERQIKEQRMDQVQLGEILFSLSYLPTAERLSIVIMKARNLNPPFNEWRSGPRQLNPFVKVVLLFDGHKIKKKKTSSSHQGRNPVYNESMMFDIPVHLLHRIIFVISVADKMAGSTRSDVIGRVVIGSPTIGEALSHWQQMLVSPRRPIAAWHRLTL